MVEGLKNLLEVQEIDLKIDSLYQEKENLPHKLERFEEILKNEEAKKKSLQEGNNNLIKERRQKELDLESKTQIRKKYQEQLYQLKSNKEYTALLQEIDNIKNEIEKLEEEILALMEEIENKEKKIVEKDKTIQAGCKDLEEATKINKEKLNEIEVGLTRFQKKREEKSFQISKQVLNEYEKIREGRGGLGIALVKNNACQGCFMELPPQVINEIKLGQRIVTCENCNRLLYLDYNL